MIEFIVKYDAEIIAFLVFAAVVLFYFVLTGRFGQRPNTKSDKKVTGTRAYTTGLKSDENIDDEI